MLKIGTKKESKREYLFDSMVLNCLWVDMMVWVFLFLHAMHLPVATIGTTMGSKGGNMPDSEEWADESNKYDSRNSCDDERTTPGKNIQNDACVFVVGGLSYISTITADLVFHKIPPSRVAVLQWCSFFKCASVTKSPKRGYQYKIMNIYWDRCC